MDAWSRSLWSDKPASSAAKRVRLEPFGMDDTRCAATISLWFATSRFRLSTSRWTWSSCVTRFFQFDLLDERVRNGRLLMDHLQLLLRSGLLGRERSVEGGGRATAHDTVKLMGRDPDEFRGPTLPVDWQARSA